MNAEIQVQWNYFGPDAGTFLLERSVDSGSTWPVKMAFPKTASSYLDTNISLYGRYWYHVAAANPKGTGSFSDLAIGWYKPPDPLLFSWQQWPYSSSIVFWNYNGTFSMSVSRSSDNGITWAPTAIVAPISQSTYYYIDRTAQEGQTYSYRIQDMADAQLPIYTTNPLTINPSSSVTTWAFTADSGFENAISADVPWERHTASVLDMNNQARGRFSASRFLLGGDDGYTGMNFHGGYQGQCFELLGPSESIWAVMGNHDFTDMGGTILWPHYFGTPTTYTRKEGPIQLFGMYSISSGDTQYSQSSVGYIALSQSLSRSLNDPSISWRVAIIHVPTVSSNWLHATNPYLQAIPWRQWGIDVVFSGHNHIVERCESSSVAFITCGVGGSHKQGYPLGAISPYSQWIFQDANNGSYDYCSGYVYNLIQATSLYMSMSFYSSSYKLHDTGSTSITNATMSGYSLILRKLPPQATPTFTASLLGPPFAAPILSANLTNI